MLREPALADSITGLGVVLVILWQVIGLFTLYLLSLHRRNLDHRLAHASRSKLLLMSLCGPLLLFYLYEPRDPE